MPDSKSTVVTNHGEFFRAIAGDETRYFAKTKKAEAVEFDANHDPVTVLGFAVYDATVSTSYAVGLYATIPEAEAHTPVAAPEAPATVFNDAPEPTPEPEPKPSPSKKRRW